MNLLFDIGHPGQVHLFRHAIEILKSKGHNVVVTVKEIPTAMTLLRKFNIKYFSLGEKYDSIMLKGFSQFRYNFRLFKIAKEHNIDVGIGSSITVAHVSRFHKMRSIILDDDDPAAVKLFANFAHPFAHSIISPSALKAFRTKKKDITYPGSHELFYLHPNFFKPDFSVLSSLGLKEKDPFFVLRFVAVKAYHDYGEEGLSLSQKLQIIDKVKPYGKVFITSEKKIEPELEQYKLSLSPEKIHHLLYFATMFIGDSQTMTSEAAILGTPALKCNSFAHRLALPNLLESKYDICYSFGIKEFHLMLNKMDTLLNMSNCKEIWKKKSMRFVSESINPTEFLVWFIENYPNSVSKLKKDPQLMEKVYTCLGD